MLQVYFIARSVPEIETASYRTLDRTPLTLVRQEGLVAAVRVLPAGARPTPERMLEYNGILKSASRRATVLPVRFGARFHSRAAVARLLAERRLELLEALDRLAAKAEIGLRLTLDSPDEARTRAAGIAQSAGVLDTWQEIHADPSGRTVLEMVLLVAARDAPACRESLQAESGEVTGPCPPRHFLPRFLRAPVATERRAARSAASRRRTA